MNDLTEGKAQKTILQMNDLTEGKVQKTILQ